MRLIALRHGETEWNVSGREQGQLDSPLTAHGMRQVEAAARRLRHHPFAALYTSDLGRAVQSAEIVARITGVAIRVEPGLRERHSGIFQGLTRVEMRERFPVQYAAYTADPYHYPVPGGETGQQRRERSARVLNALADRHADETVVVITHGGFLLGFFEHVLDLAPGNSWRFKRQNAAFNVFGRAAGAWTLETWNDTAHLDTLGSLDERAAL